MENILTVEPADLDPWAVVEMTNTKLKGIEVGEHKIELLLSQHFRAYCSKCERVVMEWWVETLDEAKRALLAHCSLNHKDDPILVGSGYEPATSG